MLMSPTKAFGSTIAAQRTRVQRVLGCHGKRGRGEQQVDYNLQKVLAVVR
jgi:hypothetical protein